MDSSNEYVIGGDELLPLIKEWLNAGQKVKNVSFRGVSMLPLLRQGKDTVEISPVSKEIAKYDLPMYLRQNGKMVLHRVVKVESGYFLCIGDNTECFEKVYPNQIIGIVTAINRGDRRIESSSFGYRLYCRLWRPTRPLRILYKRAKRLLRRCIK